MKTKTATVLSLAGVLVAGSAAALVNTQVLSGGSTPSPLVVEAAPAAATAADVVTTTVLPPAVPATGTQAPAAVATTVPTAAPVGAPTAAVYQIGESGSVTLDTAGDVLTIAAVTPVNGWTVTKSELNDPFNAEIRFQSATAEVEFHANLLFGVVTPSVESTDLTATSNSVDDRGSSGSGGGNSGDDDGSGSDDHGGGDDD